MSRKVLHVILAFLFLYGGTVAAAPMMFCKSMQKKETHSCCEKKHQQPKHCDNTSDNCPICAHNLCKIDESPAKLTTSSSSFQPIAIVAVLPKLILTGGNGEILLTSVSTFFSDGSPPLYLRDCTFRL